MHPPGGDHAQHVLSSLNQQRAVGRFCDAMLKVGDGVVFMAHRNILACFSERFQEESNITPTKTCMEVSLQECPNDGLELLLNFVYTGELKLDPVNLERVQHAAVSLCVPRALTLCQQFRECSKEAVPIKRKRGRPKNSTAVRTAYCSEKEKRPVVLDKDEPSLDAGTVTATTTRSGRKVKGPRRLVGESPLIEATLPDRASKSGLLISTESSDGVQSPLQPTTETEMTELQVNIHDNGVCQVNEDEEDDVNFRGLTLEEDSDDDYVPVAQPTAPSASTTRRRKVPSKNDQKENGEAMEDDSKKGSVQCPTCDKTFRSKYYLKVHNRRHTGEKPFACMKCGKRYFRKENLSEHESRNCAKTYMYTCPTCDATFNKKQELRLHMIHHTGEMPNKCTSCTEQFMQKKDLTLHMIKIHGFPKPHACAQCTKCFLTRTELRVHEAAKHRGEKPFVCEECGHRASSRNGLQMHIKAIHRNERPFVCIHCGHAFTQKTNLNMHLRVHTGERPYQCHLCGKTFRTQASLYKHHRTHTGERPFSCEFCEQRFTEKGPLIRHIASKHQEGRPHCCNICSKTFKAMEQLRVHVHRHKGVRKFQCPDCGYKFTRQAHLRRHCQIHKRTENYNPRQRKLRNVIVEERDNEQSETEATENLLVTEEEGYTQHPANQETSNPEPGSMPVLDPTDIVRVVIHTIDPVMEELLPIQIQSVESLVVSDVLQQSQLVTRAYEPTMIVEAMVENVSES